MALRLHDFLEPGERVVWRSRWRWLPGDWSLVLVFAPVCAAFFAMRYPSHILIFLIWLGLILLGLWLWRLYNDLRAKTLITERRVLHKAGWACPRFYLVPLDEIATVTMTESGAARVTRTRLRPFEVGDGFAAQDFALAAAGAAKLPRPATSGLLAELPVFSGLFVLSAGLAFARFLSWLAGVGIDAADSLTTGMIILGVVVYVLPSLMVIMAAVNALEHLAYWLALAVLRPRVGRRESHAWLRRVLRRRWSSRKTRSPEQTDNAFVRWVNAPLVRLELHMLRHTVGVVRRLYDEARPVGPEVARGLR